MSSPEPEIADILSSIRKMIDDRGPAAAAPAPPRPPALLLSADNLVSLPPVPPKPAPPEVTEAPSAERATGAEEETVVEASFDAPAEAPFFGAGRADWIHRPRQEHPEPAPEAQRQAVPDALESWPEDVLLTDEMDDDADLDTLDSAAPHDTSALDDTPFEDALSGPEGTASRLDTPRKDDASNMDDTTSFDDLPALEDSPAMAPDRDEGLSRIAAAAQRAVERINAERRAAAQEETPQDTAQEDAMDDSFEDNLFALVSHAPVAPVDPAPRQDIADDDALAERLADVVREQIAETLPLQIKALAPHLLDEDILRPVVADLIRKELAGAFGARITQGVRKLVRQEVHRAISLRRLE